RTTLPRCRTATMVVPCIVSLTSTTLASARRRVNVTGSCGDLRRHAPFLRAAGSTRGSVLRARERLVVNLGEAGEVDVRVALGRRETGVAEELLDGAQVGAAVQEMGRERMAERVRARVHPRAGGARVLGDDARDAAGSEAPAAHVQEDRVGIPTGARRPAATVIVERGKGGCADRDEALLAALAEDAHHLRVAVEVAPVEGGELAHPYAARVEEL